MAAYLIQDWILDDGSLVADLAMGEGNFALLEQWRRGVRVFEREGRGGDFLSSGGGASAAKRRGFWVSSSSPMLASGFSIPGHVPFCEFLLPF
jgi:hypothetical protein